MKPPSPVPPLEFTTRLHAYTSTVHWRHLTKSSRHVVGTLNVGNKQPIKTRKAAEENVLFSDGFLRISSTRKLSWVKLLQNNNFPYNMATARIRSTLIPQTVPPRKQASLCIIIVGTWNTTVPDRLCIKTVSYTSQHSSIFDMLYSVFLWFSTLGPRAFADGPSLWTSQADSLRGPDLGRDSFRRLLKTYLFTCTLYWSI